MIHREADIIQWGVERNILGPTGEGTLLAQADKSMEELDELWCAIGDNNRAAAVDAIGDIIVTLIMGAQLWDPPITMTEALDAAWSQIKDRKGRMVNGVFVKEVQAQSEP